MLILNFTEKEIDSIKNNHNLNLLKKKLEGEKEKWNKNVLLGKEDHRFNQGICCTLMDILELL